MSNKFDFSSWLNNQLQVSGMDVLDLEVASGLSRPTISGYLKGTLYPSMYSFNQILDAFGKKFSIVDKDTKLVADDEKYEKVMKGQACCMKSTRDDPFQECDKCPYNDVSVVMQDCRSVLCQETLEVLMEFFGALKP